MFSLNLLINVFSLETILFSKHIFEDWKFWKVYICLLKNRLFEKLKFYICKIMFSKKRFLEIELRKNVIKRFRLYLLENKYLYLNPKAYEQAWPWFSFPPLDNYKKTLRKNVISIFVRGSLNSGTQFRNFPINDPRNRLEHYRALKHKRKRILQ